MAPAWLKLATGVAATALVATGAWRYHYQGLTTQMSRHAAMSMLRHGITDGSVTLKSDGGWIYRIPRLSGTADAATRAAVSADLASRPAIHAVEWRDR